MTIKESLLWTEKYRPTTIEEYKGPSYLKSFLRRSKDTHTFPNLLLYGPPGTGKTTFAKILATEAFEGKALVKEFNASDERGIDVIRNQVKELALTLRKTVLILDECENLTKDSQTCLRRILEDYSETTSFIFCTNYYSRIIDPLKSRLLKFKFYRHEDFLEKIIQIDATEKCTLGKGLVKHVFDVCQGDLRKSINILQGTRGISNLDKEKLNNIMGVIDLDVIHEFINLSHNSTLFINRFLRESFCVLQLIHQLADIYQATPAFFIVLSECEEKCLRGCSEEIVLSYLCSKKMELCK